MAERKYRHPQVNLRLPEDLKERISEMAERNKRSANAEMVAAIEDWVRRDEVYNFRSETSFISYKAEDPTIDPTEEVTIPKGQLNRIVSDAAEEAAQMVMHVILEKYDVQPKNKKPT